MKSFCTLFIILCGLFVPAFGLDREAFTFTKYDLDARVEPDQQRIGVRGAITLRNDSSSPQKSFCLQISSSLTWHSVTAAGKPVQFLTQPYTSDIDHTGALSEAIVTLAQEVPPKGSVELEIAYEGVIAQDSTRLTRIGVPESTARNSDWDHIGKVFTAVRGVGYVAWYPVAMEAASLSDPDSVPQAIGRWKAREMQSELRVKLSIAGSSPQNDSDLLCNAESAEVLNEQMSRAWQVSTKCTFAPLETTVPLFVVAKYRSLEGAALDISYLADHKTAAEEYGRAADKVLPFVTDWLGEPHQKAEVLELPDSGAAPYEAGSMLLTPLNHVGAAPMELTAVHQLTHAAFYSVRPWIYEGLAHFAQALYLEHQDGRQAALNFMESHRGVLVDTEKSLGGRTGDSSAEQSLVRTELEDLYRSKALYVWWMLRDIAGEPALKKALAEYQPDQDRQPDYMQHLIEAQSKLDLQWFFDDWVYRDKGLPDFRVESVYPQQNASGGYLVAVTVENLGGAAAQVPVTVRAGKVENSLRLQVRGKSKNSIRFNVPSAPEEVVVNDGSVPESDLTNNVYKVDAPAK